MRITQFILILLILFVGFRDVLSSGGHRDMSRLLKTILKDYDPRASPCSDAQSPVHVILGLRVTAIINLSIKRQMLTIRGHFKFAWCDLRLKWDPDQYGGIRFTNLPQADIWRPDMVLSNLGGDSFLGSQETQAIISFNGSVSWEPSFTSTFACKVKISTYPVDNSKCTIKIGPWANYNTSVTMELGKEAIYLEETVANGQFQVSPGTAFIHAFPYDEWFFELATFHLNLSRKPTTVIFSLLLPMLLSGLLSPVAFLIPPSEAEKVGVAVTVLLATVVFMGAIHDDLPDKSDEASIVAVYVSSLLILTFLSVLGNTIVLMIHRKNTEEQDQAPTGGVSNLQILNKFEKMPNTPLESPLKFQGKHTKHLNSPEELVSPERHSNSSLKIVSPKRPSPRRPEGNDVSQRSRLWSRSEKLNRFFFISNSVAVVTLTVAVFALIFG